MSIFSRRHVVWILQNLPTLEEGRLPVTHSGYTDISRAKKGGGWAYFEGPAGLAAVITERLEKCGNDGVCVYLCYCFGRNWETVARMMGLDYYDMKKRMNNVIDYISGEEPKKTTYKEFRSHTKSRSSGVNIGEQL